jgi:hypothetical protein
MQDFHQKSPAAHRKKPLRHADRLRENHSLSAGIR